TRKASRVDQAVRGTMAEQGVQGAIMDGPSWPYPGYPAWPLWPQAYEGLEGTLDEQALEGSLEERAVEGWTGPVVTKKGWMGPAEMKETQETKERRWGRKL
ncbi:hypothetical protein M9458_037591, partial [Cirrhinus mrigala]